MVILSARAPLTISTTHHFSLFFFLPHSTFFSCSFFVLFCPTSAFHGCVFAVYFFTFDCCCSCFCCCCCAHLLSLKIAFFVFRWSPLHGITFDFIVAKISLCGNHEIIKVGNGEMVKCFGHPKILVNRGFISIFILVEILIPLSL